MPSAHCDSNGSSGSGDQMPDFDGVHDLDDAGSLLEHNNTDCGQPMLMPFQFNRTKTHPPHTPPLLHRRTNTLTPHPTDQTSTPLDYVQLKNQIAVNWTLVFIHFNSNK